MAISPVAVRIVKRSRPKQPLRERCQPGADREVDFVGRGEFVRDLKAGVPAPDDEHGPVGDVVGSAVVAAVELVDLSGQVLRDRGDARRLERPGGDHDLVGLVRAVVGLDEVAAGRAAARPARGG